MSRLRVLLCAALCLTLSTITQAQQVQPMILTPGTVQMDQPAKALSPNALVYVQLNGVGTLLSDIDGLLMSALPQELLPEHFKSLLELPNPGMAMLGIQTIGAPLNPEMIEMMFGLDFSSQAGLALYPMPGKPAFALFLPVKNHLNISGVLMNILKPRHVSLIKEEGHDIHQVEVGNPSLPDVLYVSSLKNGVLITSDAAISLAVLGYQGEGDAYVTSQIASAGNGCDLAVVLNTQTLSPFVAQLPNMRPMLNHGINQLIAKANADMNPKQRVELNSQLRWRYGISDINEVMYFGKSIVMGSFDTLLEELTLGMQQTRGMMLGLDLSPTHQTLFCNMDSDRFSPDKDTQPIDMSQVKTALKQLDLPWSQISVSGKQKPTEKSQTLLKWYQNIRIELVKHQVPTKLMDTFLEIYQQQHTPRHIEELSDWTIKTNLVYTPDKAPTNFATIADYFKSFEDLQSEPMQTTMMVMPKIPSQTIEQFLVASATEKTADIKLSNDRVVQLLNGGKPQLTHSYSVLKRAMPEEMELFIQQTHIQTAFGLFGFNQHELISRRYMLTSNVGDYMLLHDGTTTNARLRALKNSKTHVIDPVLEQLLDNMPQGTSYFEYARVLDGLPRLLKYAGQFEQLVHNDMQQYINAVNRILQDKSLTPLQKNQQVADLGNVPLVYQSIRQNTDDNQLYATFPLGLAFPRPRVYPVIQQLLADFEKMADKEGGILITSRTVGTQRQTRITQDTRLFGHLIQSLGNGIAKRYLHQDDPFAKLKEDFVSPMDGHAAFQEVFSNPMWEMLLADPDIERGFWEVLQEGMPLGQLGGGGGNAAHVVDVYFMDTADGTLFMDKSDQLPPIKAPSGKEGVRAFVFSCGDCGDEASRFVGWLETYTPDAKKAIEAPDPGPEQGMKLYELIENGHMMADPVTKKWVLANSEAGFKIMDAIQNRCGDKAPKPCFPGR